MLTNKDIEKIMKIVQDCKIEMTDTLFGTRPEHIKTFAEGFMRCRNKIAAELICLQDTLNKNVIPNKISIEECDFSVRTHNCLQRAGIKTLGDIKSVEQLHNVRNLGKRSVNEVIDKLREYGIELPEIEEQRTGYERVKKGEMYYLVDIYNNIMRVTEYNDQGDKQSYSTGNYYSNKMIAENNARADRLLRQLRRWQAQNDEPISVEDWNNESKKKWFIIYSYSSEEMYAEYYYIMRLPNTIYFATKEKAEEAIEVFRDELLWYFTEYVQRLDEVQND